MTWESSDTDSLLPAEIDTQLDHFLAAWRAHHQLDAARADTIRQAILKLPAALPDEWWRQYLDHLNRVLQQINRASQDTANRSHKAMTQQWPWFKVSQSGAFRSDDWQPYLKLA